MGFRLFPWATLVVALTLVSAPAASFLPPLEDDSPEAEGDSNIEYVEVDLEWEAVGDGEVTYRVYRDGTLIHTTGDTQYTDIVAPDPLTGLIHHFYEVTAQEDDGDEELVQVMYASSTPICEVIIIGSRPGQFPPIGAHINNACLPPVGGADLPPEIVFRGFR